MLFRSHELRKQGVQQLRVVTSVHIRYHGTDTALIVPSFSIDLPRGSVVSEQEHLTFGLARQIEADHRQSTLDRLKSEFEAAHKARFGFIDPSKELVVEAVSVEAVDGGAKFSEPALATTTTPLPPPKQRTRFFSRGAWRDAAVYLRDQLAPGHQVAGPGAS